MSHALREVVFMFFGVWWRWFVPYWWVVALGMWIDTGIDILPAPPLGRDEQPSGEFRAGVLRTGHLASWITAPPSDDRDRNVHIGFVIPKSTW